MSKRDDETFSKLRIELAKKPERGERSEPHWDLPFMVRVGRMDSSMAMTVSMATYTNKTTGEHMEVLTPLGGVALVLHTHDKGGKLRASYSVDLGDLAKAVWALEPELDKTENHGLIGITTNPAQRSRRKR